MSIGENIRKRRECLGISREELAKRTEISFSQLSKIERNEQKNPTIQSIIAICTAINCSVNELIYDNEDVTNCYINNIIKNLPDEDKKSIQKIARGMVLMNQAQKMVNDEHEE